MLSQLEGLRNLRRLPSTFRLLTRGAGAQFLLSLPHGALNFGILESVKDYTGAQRRILTTRIGCMRYLQFEMSGLIALAIRTRCCLVAHVTTHACRGLYLYC